MKLLHIDSSPLGPRSVSRELAQDPPDQLTAELMQVVKVRDLDNLTPRQRDELALTDALVDEQLDADIVVIGAPMYNFSIPTQLKAWTDRLAQPGRTFRYTPTAFPGGPGGGSDAAAAPGGRPAARPLAHGLSA